MTDDVALSSMPSLSETGWSVDSVEEGTGGMSVGTQL